MVAQSDIGKRFNPKLNKRAWNQVETFVYAIVADVHQHVTYSESTLLSTLGRYVLWSVDAGEELVRERLFARRMIGYGVNHAFPGMSEASRGNMRSQLLRVSEVLLDESAVLPRLPAMNAADASAPYRPTELTILRNWARWQDTPNSRQSAMAMVALGAGAGLTTRELAAMHPTGITTDEVGTIVNVPGLRPRRVPVLNAWAEMLQTAVTSADPERPLFRAGHGTFYPNVVTNFVARSAGVQLKPQMQRLRATWLVTHMTYGTPLAALLPASGLTSLESLSRYIRYLPELSEDAGRAELTKPGW